MTHSRLEILIGDCRDCMDNRMAPQSINTVVTSPPYFGLRDYGVEGQLGLEPTPDDFVAAMVEVFRSVRRVLRDDGTVWLNLGDSYARNPAKGQHKPEDPGKQAYIYATGGGRASVETATGLPDKQLLGIPWRVAFALQADGWYLRQDIIWAKPNPMPESVRDRCTKAHEYIFLLSKQPTYFFDTEAAKEPAVSTKPAGNKRHKYADAYAESDSEEHRTKAGLLKLSGTEWATRNRRSVWTVGSKPFKGAHFATFPPDLIEPCVLAGSPVGGTVLDPFGGSGTTAGVAIKHGRRAVLCELNPEYAEIMPDRIASIAGHGWDLL